MCKKLDANKSSNLLSTHILQKSRDPQTLSNKRPIVHNV